MSNVRLTRRGFIVATGASMAVGLVGCGGGSGPPQGVDATKAFLLSGKGRRVSNAAKCHNHNKIFATEAAANEGRAHMGDTSKVVPIDMNPRRWIAVFRGIMTTPPPDPLGVPLKAVVDLRDPEDRGIMTTPIAQLPAI